MSAHTTEVFRIAALFFLWGIAAITAGRVEARKAAPELGRIVQVLGVVLSAVGSICAVVYLWRVL